MEELCIRVTLSQPGNSRFESSELLLLSKNKAELPYQISFHVMEEKTGKVVGRFLNARESGKELPFPLENIPKDLNVPGLCLSLKMGSSIS